MKQSVDLHLPKAPGQLLAKLSRFSSSYVK